MSDFLTVHGVDWHSDGIFELKLERNGAQFVPGDCIALYGEDGETSRPYSFASGQDEDLHRFIIRRMPGGVVSEFLASRKPGDQVRVSPPFGWFRPGAAQNGERFVFIATGTGISPFMSYFRTHPDRAPMQLLYGVRTLNDAVHLDKLSELCDVRLATSKEFHEGHHHGRVTDLLDDMPLEDTNFYLCGLDAMIDEVTSWLEGRGVDITKIHRECFFNASYENVGLA